MVDMGMVFQGQPYREYIGSARYRDYEVGKEANMQAGADNPNNVPGYGRAFTPGLGPRVEKLERELADLKEVMAEVLERLRVCGTPEGGTE